MKNKKVAIISLVILVLIVGIILISTESGEDNDQENETSKQENAPGEQESKKANFKIQNAHSTEWSNKELENVLTEEKFKISNYKNKNNVLLESFAVWCPTCTKQQNEIKEFHKQNKEVKSISLNTDPNEDKEKVKQHAENNGFNWKYAISPRNLTKNLIDQFGQGFVNAPQSPVVLICKDGKAKMLDRGVKPAEDLKKAVNKC